MMKAAISNTQSVEDILRSYSGRRLQFAIRMGILPKPENLSKVLTSKATDDAEVAKPKVENRPAVTTDYK